MTLVEKVAEAIWRDGRAGFGVPDENEAVAAIAVVLREMIDMTDVVWTKTDIKGYAKENGIDLNG